MRNAFFCKILNHLKVLGKHCIYATKYIYNGFRNGLGMAYFKQYIRLFFGYIDQFSEAIKEQGEFFGDLDSPQKQKLQRTTLGLHSLLPADSRFTYSILIPLIEKIDPTFFSTTLKAALNQTAPHLEVLVGLSGTQSPEINQVLEKMKAEYPDKLMTLPLPSSVAQEAFASATNRLANYSKGHFLLILHPADWIRPDLLFRYEQTLRLLPHPENTILYCNEFQINKYGYPIPNTQIEKPEQPHFPYLLGDDIQHGMLIPKVLWNGAKGMRLGFPQAESFDLALRLDTHGAIFYNVPFYLYAHRAKAAVSSTEADLRALSDYVKSKKLNWEIKTGLSPQTYRALPDIKKTPVIHVIVPFKNQKELTLSAIWHILKQEGVQVKITAVDNSSDDKSISAELEKLGVEVLHIDEPFNYSRLNNLAVERTKIGKDCPYILFLNNDVDLQSDALLEMSRWIDQPRVGMVGCRLHYPNNLLQHGSVELRSPSPLWRMTWEHIERLSPFERLQRAKRIRISKAVTGACALVRKNVFLSVGGFEEIWYPIAYSDTNLAIKLALKGLLCLYTPYATGVHHESISRTLNNIEDYENSTWLHKRFTKNFLHKIRLEQQSKANLPTKK